MLAIDHKVPKVLTLKQMLQKYVEFQDCLLYTSPSGAATRTVHSSASAR